ncbi:MAG: hypothetical protein GBAus27B_000363 [Mycoplasmataceae bacterium]|nr:MAG: hypothetical protein GBAus27B_000363 [Mycoplasmataceae bacterium]
MNKLLISESDKKILEKILTKYPYQFYAYGSRVKGTAHELSDLDICYFADIDHKIIFNIKEELAESDLPFVVELVKWSNMRPFFQESINNDLVRFF